jgi:hypothetical protein
MVPLGQNRADSIPNRLAASFSRAFTVGSSPKTSSPTEALDITANILALGFVTVSDLKSIMAAKIRLQTVIKRTFYAVFVGQFCIFAHFISYSKN